jgi:hypothetical protein
MRKDGDRPPPAVERPALAQYTNYFEVGQNPYEFLIDLGQFSPEAGAVHFHTRIATAPAFAKILLATLASAIRAYELEHGEIGTSADQLDLPQVLLRSLPAFDDRARRLTRENAVEPAAPSRGQPR